MTADRLKQIEQLVHSALEHEPSERKAFLEQVCGGDHDLQQEVESLLAHERDAKRILDQPALQVMAETLAIEAPTLVGKSLGTYQILRVLGAGGMGEVYRARDTRLNREVAIKVLPRHLSERRDLQQRFEQEARAASALNHPNIITIHEIGQLDSVHYMVMELVEGKTLRELLSSGALGTKRVLQIATQVTDGLAKAHGAGIVHRDLKPENLMITKEGLVKILDFGLAKQMVGGAGTETVTLGKGTEPGILLGTVGYMSPEQARGEVVDYRSDQFSLGAILYETVTGKRAFARGSAAETLSAIVREEPEPLSIVNPKTPAPLRWVVERCLAKSPEDRYASTLDMAREVQNLRDHLSELASAEGAVPLVASDPERKRRFRVLAPIALALAVGVALAATYYLSQSNRQLLSTLHQLTFRHGTITGASFAADGKNIIYGATWDGKPSEIFMTHPESPESRSLGLHNAGIFSISPTGEMAVALGCVMNWGECLGTLARVPSTGGAPREIMQNVHFADWAPDGETLAVASPKGTQFRIEYPPGKLLYETTGWISHVRMSPKGQLIAFLDHPTLNDVGGSVCILDLTGKKRALSTGWRLLQGLAWNALGDEVWFTGYKGGPRQGPEDGLRGVTLSGQERLLLSYPGVGVLYDVSSDGHRALLKRGTPRSWVMCRTPGATKERDLSWFDWSAAADLSADGKMLLFYENGYAVRGTRTTYLRKTDGSNAVRLGEGRPLALSPDGKWALVLQEGSPPQLVLLPTGPGEQRPLPRGAISEYLFAGWFPDGRQIFFSGAEAGHPPRTYIQDIGSGELHPVTPEGLVGALLSPDGKLIASFDRHGEFYLCAVDGGEPRDIDGYLEGDILIQWSGDGRSLFLREAGAGELALKIYKLDIVSGRREFWMELTPPDSAGLIDIGSTAGQVRLTPDGKSYVFTYWTFPSELYLVEGLK
jgi:serine/threonine protein kinase